MLVLNLIKGRKVIRQGAFDQEWIIRRHWWGILRGNSYSRDLHCCEEREHTQSRQLDWEKLWKHNGLECEWANIRVLQVQHTKVHSEYSVSDSNKTRLSPLTKRALWRRTLARKFRCLSHHPTWNCTSQIARSRSGAFPVADSNTRRSGDRRSLNVVVFNFCIRTSPTSVGMALRAVPKIKRSWERLGNASLPRLDGRKSCPSRLFDPSREITEYS